MSTFFLVLAILLLIAGMTMFSRARFPEDNIPSSRSRSKVKIIQLDQDELTSNRGSDNPKRFIPSAMTLAGAVFCLGLFGFLRTPKVVHELVISYEQLAITAMASHLNSYFEQSTLTLPIRTLIVARNQEEPYTASLIATLTARLAPSTLVVDRVLSIGPSNQLIEDPGLSFDDYRSLVSNNRDTGLIIILNKINVGHDTRRYVGKRPFIAEVSATADLYDQLALIKMGIIDLALVSRGNFITRAIIPTSKLPEAIFDDHFIMLTPANANDIASRNRQTIALVTD